MNRLITLFFLIFLFQNLTAQVELSGVINQYTSVTAIESDSCSSQVTVADASNFSVGNMVVLIQMQGAQIVENNSSAFGDIASLNSTGLYEIQQIKSIVGQDIFFEKQFINTYNLDGKVQLINMPTHELATVSNTLTADPWNGETGGVLALQVDGELVLNANIDVSNLGFRGGIPQTASNNNCTWLFQQSDYFYGFGNWRGAAKGEGIASIITGKEFGKGPQANGGGGGNDHNSGGGGGAHISDGGFGGENDEPSTFGCQGNHPGEGGKGISTNSTRLFLGGGGGAGHDNNGQATNGGNGGGIIILIVNDFVPAGFSILSNGENVIDGGGDGGGGGGAGGTILLDVQNIISTVHLEVRGGKGGLVDNMDSGDTQRCHGPGGGGSGGRILSSLMMSDPFSSNISGGEAGLTINSTSCPEGTNGAQDGVDGVLENLDFVAMADENFNLPIPDFSFDISGLTINFSNQSQNANSYFWTFGDAYTNDNSTPSHTYNQGGFYEVQLVVTNACGSDSLTQIIEIIAPPTAGFASENTTEGCAPFTIGFSEMIIGQVDSFYWTFEGGTPTNSTDPSPEIIYETPGIYNVTLEAYGPGGADTVSIDEFVVIIFAPVAAFDYTIDGAVVTFQNLSTNATEIIWNFGDGSPSVNTLNPVYEYDTAGIYEVSLMAFTPLCDSVLTQTIVLDFTSVEDLEKLGLEIFPNPANKWLTIQKHSTELTRLKVYGIDGKEIPHLAQEFSETINLDIQNLPAGVYFLNLLQGEKVGQFRLVKIK